MHNWSQVLIKVCRIESYLEVHETVILNAGKRAEATNLVALSLDDAGFGILGLDARIRTSTQVSQ